MSRVTSLRGDWAALAEAYGGVQGLADALGVSPQSVWSWGTGRREVVRTTAIAVQALARRKRLESPV